MRANTKRKLTKAGLGLAGIVGLGIAYPIGIHKAFDITREKYPNLTAQKAQEVFEAEKKRHFGGAGRDIHFKVYSDRELRSAGYPGGYAGINDEGAIFLGLPKSSLDEPSIVYLTYLARNYPDYLESLGRLGRGKRRDIRELREYRGDEGPITSRAIGELPNHLRKKVIMPRQVIKPLGRVYTMARCLPRLF